VLAVLSSLRPGEFVVVVAIAAGLSMLVFRHASRNGSRHATAWGVLTFLAAGIFLPAYFLNWWLTRRR
jgi:hypothetical protein